MEIAVKSNPLDSNMSDEAKTNVQLKKEKEEGSGKIIRILSLDGGGIYGLFTVLMLKELCMKNEDFLKGDDVHLFAGTSAGALIALALAKAENPRDVILNGELEKFFADGRLYGKGQRPSNILSGLMGITSWSGSHGAVQLYQEYFGDLLFSKLKHKVLISSFNLSGNPEARDGRRWKPKMFDNFPNFNESEALKVWEVAYGASAPVMWRPIMRGISDGGIFADSPTMHTIAKILQHRRDWNESLNIRNTEEERDRFSVDETLKSIRLLSLGVGNKIPYYNVSDFNLGYLSFNLLPTNFKNKDFYPAIFYLMLDPQVETSSYEAKQLIQKRFRRLSPGVLQYPIPPILAAMYLSRWDLLRQRYIKTIHEGMNDSLTKEELSKTEAWLTTFWRLKDDPPAKIGFTSTDEVNNPSSSAESSADELETEN